MKTLEEIESAIAKLSPHELDELYAWMEQHAPQPIDEKLASDLTTGRLDNAIARALADESGGRVRPL